MRLGRGAASGESSRSSSLASLHWAGSSEGGSSFLAGTGSRILGSTPNTDKTLMEEQQKSLVGELGEEEMDSSVYYSLEGISTDTLKPQEKGPPLSSPRPSHSGSSLSGDTMDLSGKQLPDIVLTSSHQEVKTEELAEGEEEYPFNFELSSELPSYIASWQERSWREDGSEQYQEATGYQLMAPTWVWISAGACKIDEDSTPNQWTSSAKEANNIQALNTPWRQRILEQFQRRSHQETASFRHLYPDAIEKSSWVKSGRFHLWSDHNTWEEGTLELNRQGSTSNQSQEQEWATLTCCCRKRKFVISLSEVLCVANLSTSSKHMLALHVKHKPLIQMAFMTHADLGDWLGTLNSACSDLSSSNVSGYCSSLWSTTVNGEVFVVDGSQLDIDYAPPAQLFWHLLGGGHLRKVESSPGQLAWGLGYNNLAWVYTKGYGGGPYAGLVGRNSLVHTMSDSKCMFIYENQRWNPLTGFSATGLPTDRYMWSDSSGRIYCTKENTQLPSHNWQWVSDWNIDFKTPGGVDKEGWQYASDFPRSYHAQKGFTDYVRRRRWARRCKVTTSGPWVPAGTTKLLDVSIQLDFGQETGRTLAIWAVAGNGDALYRVGVTLDQPRGDHWVPVSADQALVSISVGNGRNVWAVARDGTAFYRHGVHPIHCPLGQHWVQVESPSGSLLKQISVGRSSVFASDEQQRLWFRHEIVSIFPEGTSWSLVADHIRDFSVGSKDQLWALLDEVRTSTGTLSGVVCRRKGVTEQNPSGTSWEVVIGGGWQSISCRAITSPSPS